MANEFDLGGTYHGSISGTRVFILLDPREREGDFAITAWSNVGSGVPESVHNRRVLAISVSTSVDLDAVREFLESELGETMLSGIADCYLDEKWDGHNLIGMWDDDVDVRVDRLEEALSELPTYCDASDYFAQAESDVMAAGVNAIRDGLTFAEFVGLEVASAGENGYLLDRDDAEKAIRRIYEQRIEKLDGDDPEERLERIWNRKVLRRAS